MRVDAPSESFPRDRPRSATFHTVTRALQSRNYRLYFSGQIVSLTGTWMQTAALWWLAYRLSGSSATLGAIVFAGQIPIFLLAPLGGVLADRFEPRRAMLASQIARLILALILTFLAFDGIASVGILFGIALLSGGITALDMPVRQKLVADLVGRQDLVNAIGLNSSMFNLARMIGPALAGLLIHTAGEAWCFLLNAVSYLAVLAGLHRMRLSPRRGPRPAGLARDEILEGMGFVARHRPCRALVMLLGISSLLGMPYMVLMPFYADQILDGGSLALGLLMASSGVGAFAGALLLAARQSIEDLGEWVLRAAALLSLSLLLFSFSRTLWLSALLLIPAGFAMVIQVAAANTLLQTMAPDRLRGRIMAVYSMVIFGLAPLGALVAGGLAEVIGAPDTIALGAVAYLGVSIGFWKRLPKWRYEAKRWILRMNRLRRPVAKRPRPGDRTASRGVEGRNYPVADVAPRRPAA